MNREEARRVLDVLMSAWPRTELPDETVRTWVRMLTDLPYDVGQAAAESIIKADKYFPSIARYREAVSGSAKNQRHEWTAVHGCPTCDGTAFVIDANGRDWLCRCATYDRKPRPMNPTTAPPAALLKAARNALPNRTNTA